MSELTKIQRNLTVNFIDQRRLNVSVIWFKSESAVPVEGPAQTVPKDWLNEGEERNLGAELRDGFVELQIKAPDDIWFKLFASQVDARAAWGGYLKPVSSVLFKIADPRSIEAWIDRWPRGSKDKANAWVETKLAYSLQGKTKPIPYYSAPLPGSRFAGDTIVWRPGGKPAADNQELGTEDLEARPVPATNCETICRAIAFATLGYWIRIYLDGSDHWDESLLRTLGGWIAREAFLEGPAVNERNKKLGDLCWAPIDNGTTAAELIQFLAGLGAPRELEGFFHRAELELDRNREAPVSGWPALERTLGVQAKIGIRRAFRAGADINAIERFRERYVFNTSEDVYIDREALLRGVNFERKFDALVRIYDNESIILKNKPYNVFRLYSQSKLRTDVMRSDGFPGQEPGAILRYSPVHGLINNDDRQPDEYHVLNTYRGFIIKPAQTINATIMRAAVSALDTMLGYLTQDNDAQILWLKKFIAWIIQHPEIKQQVCPVVIGGQGVGKSVFGDEFMKALFGELAGAPAGFAPAENRFTITPFVGRLITFIDEVRLKDRPTIDELKKIIRTVRLAGREIYKSERQYDIYSRVLLAANQPNIGLSPEDRADRAFFFIISYTAENKHMLTQEFQQWAWGLKPFYNELITNLKNVLFRQHLMRYFVDLEVNREELEDLTHSSRDDEQVVTSTMSQARLVARYMIADARVVQTLDITAWFNMPLLSGGVQRVAKELNIRPAETLQVLFEFQRASIVEEMGSGFYRFKYRYGDLIKKLGDAHGLAIMPQHPVESTDHGPNTVTTTYGAPEWRGKNRQAQQDTRKRYDRDVDDIGMSD